MRTRYYNPEVKRFINQDTILGSITNSQSLNRYAYVQGNSISLIDPFGMSPSAGNNAIGHTLLDFTGLIPGIGFVFDVANSVWYVAEGNYTMAALAAFSAIPGLGDAVSASKLATKGAKAAELCNIIKKIGCAAKVAENAGEFGINANNAYKDIKEGNVGIGTFASLFAAGLNAFGIYASVKRFNSISVNTGKVTDGVEGVNKAEEKYHIGLGNDLDNYDYNKANKEYESIMSGGSSSGSKSKWWHEGYVDNLSDTQMILGVKQSDKGLSTLGSATRENAMSAGKAWVGENYNVIQDNAGNVLGYSSADGMRAFRIQYKPKEGMWRANFQENIMVNNPYSNLGQHSSQLKNVHIDILD